MVPEQSGPVGPNGLLIVFPATMVFWTRRVPPVFKIPPPLAQEAWFSRIVLLVMETWPPKFATPPPPSETAPATFFAMVLLTISTDPPTLRMPPPGWQQSVVLKMIALFLINERA